MSREIWFSNYKREPGRGPGPWFIGVALIVAIALMIVFCL